MPDLTKKYTVHDELVGQQVLGKFQIEQILSSAGSGTVYKAIQLAMERTIAFKVLSNELSGDELGLKRFRREAKAARAFGSHPGLATVYECGFLDDNRPFIAMQLAEGETLASRLENCGILRAEQAIPLFAHVADAMAFAHANEVLHRDICPSNIMMSPKGSSTYAPKVIDFGLARPTGSWALQTAQLTRFSSALGNPQYMSPEQCSGKDLDARSDIYSLGCTMYETVTGSVPFKGRSTLESMQKQHSEIAQNPVIEAESLLVSNALASVIMFCLEKDPDKRYSNMDELRLALEAAGEGRLLEPAPYDPDNVPLKTIKTDDPDQEEKPRVVPLPPVKPPQENVTHQSLVRSAIRSAIEVQWGLQRILLIVASIAVVVVFAVTVAPQLFSQLKSAPEPEIAQPITGDIISVKSTMGSFDFTLIHPPVSQCTFPGLILVRKDRREALGQLINGKFALVRTVSPSTHSVATDGKGTDYVAIGDAVEKVTPDSSLHGRTIFNQSELQDVRFNPQDETINCSAQSINGASNISATQHLGEESVGGTLIISLDGNGKIKGEHLIQLDDPHRSNRFALGPDDQAWTWAFDGTTTKFYCAPLDKTTEARSEPRERRSADFMYSAPVEIEQMYFQDKALWLITKSNQLWRVRSTEHAIDVFDMPDGLTAVDMQITEDSSSPTAAPDKK